MPRPETHVRLCGNCYLKVRPTEYEPNTYIDGECTMCGEETFVHRVAAAEVKEYLKNVASHSASLDKRFDTERPT